MARLDEKSRALVERNLGIARQAAAERYRRGPAGWHDWEAATAAAYFGLVLAAARYDGRERTWEAFARAACHQQISKDRRPGRREPGAAREPLPDLPAPGSTPLESLVAAEDIARLRAAVAALPPSLRVVVRRRLDGELYRDIELAIGRSKGCARLRDLKAIAILKESLASLA